MRDIHLPAPAQCLVQRNAGLQPGQAQLYVLVLGLIQRALGLQDREQYLGPGFIAVFGNIECLLCLFQFFVLPVPLLVQTTGAVEGFSTSARALMMLPR